MLQLKEGAQGQPEKVLVTALAIQNFSHKIRRFVSADPQIKAETGKAVKKKGQTPGIDEIQLNRPVNSVTVFLRNRPGFC